MGNQSIQKRVCTLLLFLLSIGLLAVPASAYSSYTGTSTVKVGGTAYLSDKTDYGSNIAATAWIWESTDYSVVSIVKNNSTSCQIKGLKEGTATVYCTTTVIMYYGTRVSYGQMMGASYTVTVTDTGSGGSGSSGYITTTPSRIVFDLAKSPTITAAMTINKGAPTNGIDFRSSQFNVREKQDSNNIWKYSLTITRRVSRTGSYTIDGNYVYDGVIRGSFSIPVTVTCSHRYGDWETTRAATCARAGVKQRECSCCGNVQTDVLPLLNTHEYDKGIVVTPAAYQKEGLRRYTCTICQATMEETLPALEHDITFPSIIFDPAARSVSVQISCDCNAVLFAALYNEDGLMRDTGRADIAAGIPQTASIHFKNASGNEHYSCKVFLLSDSCRPLCPCVPVPHTNS